MKESKEVKIVESGVMGEFPYTIVRIRFVYPEDFLKDNPVIARSSTASGWENGYLGVPPGHPWYEQEYDNLENVHVHGGLTYSGRLQDNEYARDEPWQGMDIWWVGFDTVHVFDHDWQTGRWLRDTEYVRNECRDLARQAAEALHGITA